MDEQQKGGAAPYIVGGLALVGVAGLAYWKFGGASATPNATGQEKAIEASAGAYVEPPAGVSVKGSHVKLNARTAAFLAELRARVPEDVPLLVTDAARTISDQVARIYDQYKKEGVGAVKALYSSSAATVAKLVAAFAVGDLQAAAKVLSDATAEGLFISDHLDMPGREATAFDLRSWAWTAANLEKVKAEVKGLGASGLVESDHYHVEDLPTVEALAKLTAERTATA